MACAEFGPTAHSVRSVIVIDVPAVRTSYSTCRPGAASEPGTGRCGFLGYVFRNVDTDGDGLVDGQEWMLGTDPTRMDTDNDGFSDSVEFPPYRYLPRSNPAQSKPDPIFANGVEL